jgi:MFS family permease
MNSSLLWLAAALLTWGVGEGMFMMFQPIYLAELGANAVQIGSILGGFGIAMMLAHIPAGYLADRIGRRPMLLTAWCIGLAATLVMASATSLPAYVLGMLLYGFTAFVASPLNSYVTAARGLWSVGRALTLISATFNLGYLAGPTLGGWLAEQIGLKNVYFVASGLFVLSTLLLFRIAPQARDHHDPSDPPQSLFKNHSYLGFLSLGFFVLLFIYFPQPFSAKFLQDVRQLSLSEIGILGTIGGLGNTTMNFLLGNLEARRGFILAQIGVAAFSLILWLSTGFTWIAIAYFLLGGYRAGRSLYTAQIRPLVHESQMGLAYGIAETVGALTISIGPVIAGFIYAQAPIAIYPIAFVAVLIGLGLTLGFLPRPRIGGESA